MGEHEPKSAGLYRKSTGSNASTLARSKTHSLARAKRGEPDSLSASEEEDLKDRYYAYWERQKQVGRGCYRVRFSHVPIAGTTPDKWCYGC